MCFFSRYRYILTRHSQRHQKIIDQPKAAEHEKEEDNDYEKEKVKS